MDASKERPRAAPEAAINAASQGLESGNLRPKNPINIHVGGANAGNAFKKNTARNSANKEAIVTFYCADAPDALAHQAAPHLDDKKTDRPLRSL